MTRRLRSIIAAALAVGAISAMLVALPAAAAPSAGPSAAATKAGNLDLFPTEIALPNGCRPAQA